MNSSSSKTAAKKASVSLTKKSSVVSTPAKTPAKTVRIGVIGVGLMGAGHTRQLQQGLVPGAKLVAICDSLPANLAKFENVEKFSDAKAMIKSGLIDAVIIVTPHFSHAPLSILALEAGLHVLVEKPITVKKSDAEKIIAAHKDKSQVFAIMFNQRTDPVYRQLHKWIGDGTLGRIQRIQWTITDWFRPECYYASGSWRGTWAGEGGGILLNQAPHQLDLWQWLFGMPARVRAFGGTGRHHKIEVEDDVTAIFEYANGTIGVFVSTTGEAPGVNRLEVAGDKGLVIVEGRTLKLVRNKVAASEFSKTTTAPFSRPEIKEKTIVFKNGGPQHLGILKNFVESIRKGTPLIAPGAEGIRSLELANSAVVSLIGGKPVELPMKAEAFNKVLASLIAKSKKK